MLIRQYGIVDMTPSAFGPPHRITTEEVTAVRILYSVVLPMIDLADRGEPSQELQYALTVIYQMLRRLDG